MTTGATGFTRAAGLAGVLSPVLWAAAFMVELRSSPWSSSGGGAFWMFAAIAASAVFCLGLLVRHRALWWSAPARVLLAIALMLGVLAAAGEVAGLLALAGWIGGLTVTGVLLGVFLAGDLPRFATFLMLLPHGVDSDDRPRSLVLAAMLAGFTGYVCLGWAMFREPSPTPYADVPREPVRV